MSACNCSKCTLSRRSASNQKQEQKESKMPYVAILPYSTGNRNNKRENKTPTTTAKLIDETPKFNIDVLQSQPLLQVQSQSPSPIIVCKTDFLTLQTNEDGLTVTPGSNITFVTGMSKFDNKGDIAILEDGETIEFRDDLLVKFEFQYATIDSAPNSLIIDIVGDNKNPKSQQVITIHGDGFFTSSTVLSIVKGSKCTIRHEGISKRNIQFVYTMKLCVQVV